MVAEYPEKKQPRKIEPYPLLRVRPYWRECRCGPVDGEEFSEVPQGWPGSCLRDSPGAATGTWIRITGKSAGVPSKADNSLESDLLGKRQDLQRSHHLGVPMKLTRKASSEVFSQLRDSHWLGWWQGLLRGECHLQLHTKLSRRKNHTRPRTRSPFFLLCPRSTLYLPYWLYACWQRNIDKVQFQYHTAGKRRANLEFRGNKLITGTRAKSGILEYSFIKEPPRKVLPNFLTLHSLIY